MKLILSYAFIFCALVFCFSCQKEYSFEVGNNPAKGSLQSEVSTECLPKTVAGAFIEGNPLTDSNYIEIEVNVTKIGFYSIKTDTINGFSFKATGSFSNVGATKVKLKGNGIPITQGVSSFLISFDTSYCYVQVIVLPAGSGGPATFTLEGSGGNCLDANVQGSYIKGTALNSSNTVDIKVNVTSIGTYNISTASINGITFSATGTYSTTGVQLVTLNGSGTPVNEGLLTVGIVAGSSTCSFVVNILATTPPPPSGDYFPLTANSWWSYDDPDGIYDSLMRVNIDAITLNGNVYRIFQGRQNTTPVDSFYYRRNGNDYFEWALADNYSSLEFDAPTPGDINFLKETLSTNDTWQSDEYSGTVTSVPVKIRYVFTCTNSNATVTINGKVFTNVYKISWKPQYNALSAGYMDDLVSYETYYAKGIGIIYWKAVFGTTTYELKIRNWQVF